jgi:hypothetical protein
MGAGGGTSGTGTNMGGMLSAAIAAASGAGGIGTGTGAGGTGGGSGGGFGGQSGGDPWAGNPPSSIQGGQTYKHQGPYPHMGTMMSNDQAQYYKGLMEQMKGNSIWDYDPVLRGQDAHAWYVDPMYSGGIGQSMEGIWITPTGFGPNGELAAFPGGMGPGVPGYEDMQAAMKTLPAWGGNIQWAVNDERYKELFDALQADPNLMNQLIGDPLSPVWYHFSTPQLMEASALYNEQYPVAGVAGVPAAAVAPPPAAAAPAYVAPVDYGSKPGDRTNSGPGGGRDTGKGDGGRDGGGKKKN